MKKKCERNKPDQMLSLEERSSRNRERGKNKRKQETPKTKTSNRVRYQDAWVSKEKWQQKEQNRQKGINQSLFAREMLRVESVGGM